MNMSIENTNAMPGTRAGFKAASVAGQVMRLAPSKPLVPFNDDEGGTTDLTRALA